MNLRKRATIGLRTIRAACSHRSVSYSPQHLKNATMSIETSYIDLYLANLDLLREGVSDIVNRHRSDAIESFNLLGIPSKKAEKYKYTDLQEVFSREFEKYFTPRKEKEEAESLFTCDVPELDSYKIYLVNGFYHGSNRLVHEGDVVFGSFAAASIEFPELFKKHYNRYADNAKEGITALNTAFAQDGVFIHVPRSASLSKPIQIINLLLSDSEDLFVQDRNLLIFEENVSAKVLVCTHTISPKQFLSNSVTEVYIAPSANVELVRTQDEHNLATHINSDYIRQEEKSVFTGNTITIHGGLVRNNLNVELAGEYCENHSYGLFLTDRQQHVDNHTFIDHAVPNCTSNELYKGIVDEKSTGVFNGSILVRRDAQKTQAFQSSNNLILTPGAKVYAKPQLEIYADDVKCSHGATVGQLDAEALFYMQSRGVGKREAQLLQLYGFAFDVLQKLSIEPLRDQIGRWVDRRLRGDHTRCETCAAICYEKQNETNTEN